MKEQQHRKLNVGCGFDYRQGYVNVDLHERHQPDVVANVLDLATFATGYYEELVAQDVLEHVTRDDVRRALFEWNRVLAVGGRMFIRTTELGGLVRALESPENQGLHAQERLVQNLFGTQAYTGDFHLSGFTEPLFRHYLWEAGFEIASLELHQGVFLDCWARKARDLGFERVDARPVEEPFICSSYADLLGRQPSEAELQVELQARSKRELLMKLLLSEERKNLMFERAPPFPRTLHVPHLLLRAARRAKRLVKALL